MLPRVNGAAACLYATCDGPDRPRCWRCRCCAALSSYYSVPKPRAPGTVCVCMQCRGSCELLRLPTCDSCVDTFSQLSVNGLPTSCSWVALMTWLARSAFLNCDSNWCGSRKPSLMPPHCSVVVQVRIAFPALVGALRHANPRRFDSGCFKFGILLARNTEHFQQPTRELGK